MFDLIVGARAVQFASSILVAGAAIFSLVVVVPALNPHDVLLARKQRQLDGLILAALGFAIVSGALWLLSLAAEIGHGSTVEALTNGTAWTFLTETQFGRVSEIRLALAVILAAFVLMRPLVTRLAMPAARATASLGTGFVASLAWCGHAGGGLGFGGEVHVASDVVHLVAAAAWVGGLIPLLLLTRPRVEMPSVERFQFIRRFSSLAVLAVAGLVASGVINAWFMLNGWRDLIATDYGRLVLVKVALFLAMLAFAAANRLWLTPRLGPTTTSGAQRDALRHLCVLTAIEVILGIAVICVVALLGQLPPAAHARAAA
jgi:putative copper resistance protein D